MSQCPNVCLSVEFVTVAPEHEKKAPDSLGLVVRPSRFCYCTAAAPAPRGGGGSSFSVIRLVAAKASRAGQMMPHPFPFRLCIGSIRSSAPPNLGLLRSPCVFSLFFTVVVSTGTTSILHRIRQSVSLCLCAFLLAPKAGKGKDGRWIQSLPPRRSRAGQRTPRRAHTHELRRPAFLG